MKNNKIIALCILLVSSLTGCNLSTSSITSNSNILTSSSLSSSTSKESTTISSSTSSSVSSSETSSTTISSEISSSSSTKHESTSSSTSTNSSTTSSEVVLEDLKEKIELGLNNLNKVKGGTLTYNEGSDVVSTYEYGVDQYGDFVHINEKGTTDKYYGYNGSNEVYGLQVSNGKMRIPLGDITEKNIYGPYISPFGYGEKDKMFGVRGVMEEFLNAITLNANKDFLNMSTESEGYKFSFGKVVKESKTSLWISTISFELEEDTFKNIECTFKKYTSITADFENDGVYYLNSNAKATQTKTAKFEQVLGNRDATNPHDIETYYISSYDLKDDKGNLVGDTFTMNAETPEELTVENVLPETASSAIDTISISEATGKVKGTYTASTGIIKLTSSVEGDYEVVLKTKKTTRTINVRVNKSIPKTLTILFYVKCGKEYSVDLLYDEKTTITSFVNSDVYVKPSFSPSKADQSNTIEVTSDNKDKLTIEKTQIENIGVNNTTMDVYRFNASEVGTYDVTITSTADPTITMNFKYEVKEVPVFDELLKDRYVRNVDGEIYIDVDFLPNSENKKEGIVSIKDRNGYEEDNCSYKYIYNESLKEFELTKLDENGNELTDEVMIKLEFNANYELIYSNRKSSEILHEFSHALMISRIEWNGFDSGKGATLFKFNDDYTGTFTYSKSNANFETIAYYSCDIKFTVEEDGEAIYVTIDEKSLEDIYKSGIVSKVGVIKLDPSYQKFELTMTIYGKEETITFVHGG